MNGYTNRITNAEMLQQSLWILGYADFLAYRESDVWKGIRDSALKRYPCCYRCKSAGIDVHLARYDLKSVSGDRPGSLYSLCRRCIRRTVVCEWGASDGLARANARLGIRIKDLPLDAPIRRSPSRWTGRKYSRRYRAKNQRKSRRGELYSSLWR